MTTTSLLNDALEGLALDKEEYISLMEKLIGESQYVQNNPRQGLTPNEEKVAQHVLEILEPLSTKNGGPLIITTPTYKPGRPNIKIVYPGTSTGGGGGEEEGAACTGLIGSHLDVVPGASENITDVKLFRFIH